MPDHSITTFDGSWNHRRTATGLHMKLRDELEEEEEKTTKLRKKYVQSIVEENIQLRKRITDIKAFHYKQIDKMEEDIDDLKKEIIIIIIKKKKKKKKKNSPKITTVQLMTYIKF